MTYSLRRWQIYWGLTISISLDDSATAGGAWHFCVGRLLLLRSKSGPGGTLYHYGLCEMAQRQAVFVRKDKPSVRAIKSDRAKVVMTTGCIRRTEQSIKHDDSTTAGGAWHFCVGRLLLLRSKSGPGGTLYHYGLRELAQRQAVFVRKDKPSVRAIKSDRAKVVMTAGCISITFNIPNYIYNSRERWLDKSKFRIEKSL